jgi:cysteine desulfurase
VKPYLFFDNASTSRCSDAAAELVKRFAVEDFGNPSSSHAFGQQAQARIKEARKFFATTFNVEPSQVIFTGSGSEADNLAVYGVAMDAWVKRKKPFRVVTSSIEHAAVKKTVQSLADYGLDVQFAGATPSGHVDREKLVSLITPDTVLASVQQVNNILGTIMPVEELAAAAKERNPSLIFHTDAVQAFGKVDAPKAPSAVDLVSISAHKVCGPKGVGALIVLNKQLLKSGMRPLIWGGEQEGGFRSGTQSAGLIAGFHLAAEQTLASRKATWEKVSRTNLRFRELLAREGLLDEGSEKSVLRWNSPPIGQSLPQIVSLSIPGYPSGSLAQLLEERGCLVSTGSACSSGKAEPDAVLVAMGLPKQVYTTALRISFSSTTSEEDVERLARAFKESIELMTRLLSGKAQ